VENILTEISKVVDVSPADWEEFKPYWAPITLKKGERSEYAGFFGSRFCQQ
jgi:hypothetical protein